MLVYQTNPVGIRLFSSANTFSCSNKFAWLLAKRVKTLFGIGMECSAQINSVSLRVFAVLTSALPKIAFLLILSKMARLLGHTHRSRLDIAALSAAVSF